jgi:Ca-activated chloride channel family protein
MDFEIRYGDKNESRMEVAKKVVEEFIIGNDKGLSGRPDDLIGVITFARYPDTICPMTLGHDALIHMVRELTINERPNEDGTAYADAIRSGVARLVTMGKKEDDEDIASKVIILLTDGENNSGDALPEVAARFAQEEGVKVYTISIESEPQDKIRRNRDGSLSGPPPKSANAKILESVASMTGGIYRAAHSYDSLSAVYKQINELEKTKMKAVNFTDTKSAFHYFAIAALLFLSLSYLLNTTILRISP